MRISALLAYLLIMAFSCTQKEPGGTTFPPHYSKTPTVLKLEKELEEISGLSYDASDNTVYAICDNKGSLYKISLVDGKVLSSVKFHKQENFEDLVIIGDTCYVLNSNGDIVSFNYKAGEVNDAPMHQFSEKGENELEILYQNKPANNLMLICKNCDRDKKKEVSTFSYNTASGTYSDGPFSLDAKEILKNSEVEKNRFKPSAAAINPVTGDLYIVSSINKLLVITDIGGTLKQAYPLDAKMFKQPEGIAFTPKGDMLISNESAGKGKATILIYKYQD